jgi:DNA-binding NarL/FixJ family response regulator
MSEPIVQRSTVDRPRLLVVDDNVKFRATLKLLLEDYEIDVVGEAGNGAEAVEMTEALLPDVVLMDLRMPVMDGIASARIIKERLPRIQVIILSAYDDVILRADAERAQVRGYLVKGSDSSQILEGIFDAWDIKRALEEFEPAADSSESETSSAPISSRLDMA